MTDINPDQFADLLLQQTPLLDVRAEIEFSEGKIPGAINYPILNTDERAQVGTCYKQQGQESAIKLGHHLVSGENRDKKIEAWVQWRKQNVNGVIYCFRGGMRSRITQEWLKEAGYPTPKVTGGYKALRNFLIENINSNVLATRFLILSGATGSGKSRLIQELKNEVATIDLEGLANHMGSAFGGILGPQPTQIDFENNLSGEFLKLNKKGINTVLLEDESRLIGHRSLPLSMYEKMKTSPVFVLQLPREDRIENIYQDYIQKPLSAPIDTWSRHFDYLRSSLLKIQKKLGSERLKQILLLLNEACLDSLLNSHHESHKLWIESLLTSYYDPIYKSSLERNHSESYSTGDRAAFLKWLQNQSNSN